MRADEDARQRAVAAGPRHVPVAGDVVGHDQPEVPDGVGDEGMGELLARAERGAGDAGRRRGLGGEAVEQARGEIDCGR